jgi:protein translocase SecG subunit
MNIISILQIIVSVFLIILVLLQQRGSGLGATFGQEGGAYATRRGAQKKIFGATIVLGIAFVILALLSLLL